MGSATKEPVTQPGGGVIPSSCWPPPSACEAVSVLPAAMFRVQESNSPRKAVRNVKGKLIRLPRPGSGCFCQADLPKTTACDTKDRVSEELARLIARKEKGVTEQPLLKIQNVYPMSHQKR
mmetsp:Transcript_60476/g.128193  ORF Transcript_60476/g.128193 Transcript_60476/m.128193 type:complete len:121 (+) Transcript_60476:1017-1379(+)